MRCLPPTPFPMPKKTFPLSYPLPNDRTTVAAQAAANRKEQNSSLYNRTLRNSLTKNPLKSPVKSKGHLSTPQKSSSIAEPSDSAVDDASPSSGMFYLIK